MDPLTKGTEDTDIVRAKEAGGGRMGVYTALGALSGVFALPFLPDTLARRVRGALAHDLCTRAGVTLTEEARALLSEPETDLLKGPLGQAARFVASRWLRRFTPLGFLPPVRTAITTFALGHLLGRYLARHRSERATRMDVDEAKKVKRLIDRTLVDVLRSDLAVPREHVARGEDLRDGVTQVVDGVVIAIAGLPDMAVRRLDVAFDAAVRRETP